MSKTFFDGQTKRTYDRINLTRFSGGLQISTVRFLESPNCPPCAREPQFLPGWSYVNVSREEALVLRDQLTRYLNGETYDCCEEEDFDNNSSTTELFNVVVYYPGGQGSCGLFRGTKLGCEAFIARVSKARNFQWVKNDLYEYGGFWINEQSSIWTIQEAK